MTGARKGQLTQERGKDDPDPIRWRDVCLDGAPSITFNDTKNGDNWFVPLCDEAAETLRKWRETCSAAGPDDFVFPFRVRDEAVNADLKEAKIPKHGGPTNRPANFHSLRKTYCTNLVLSGVPVPVAQRLMQHRTLEMTLKVYTEVRNEQLAAGIAQVQDFFNVGKLGTANGLQGRDAEKYPANVKVDLTGGGGFADDVAVTTTNPVQLGRSEMRGQPCGLSSQTQAGRPASPSGPAAGSGVRSGLTRAEKDELLRKIMLLLTAVTLAFVFVITAKQAAHKLIEFADSPPVGR